MTAIGYVTPQEAQALQAEWLASTDPRARAYTALSDADRAACLRQAAAHLDAMVYVGGRLSPSQPGAWPRQLHGWAILTTDDDRPSPLGQPYELPGVPLNIRIAQSIQAAMFAAESMGLIDSPGPARLAANIDPRVRTDPDAWRLIVTYLATGVDLS